MSQTVNRQQRRLRAKEREKEEKFLRMIKDRQDRVDDRVIELTAVCIALALNDLYRWSGTGIQRVITQFCTRMASIDQGETYDSLREELERKTGIVFRWKR